MNTVIKTENLSKKYIIGGSKKPSIHQSLNGLFSRNTKNEFWALKDINIEIKEGEAVGIIGRNGSGKSTLLKILSRITQPTYGKAVIAGRVASLLEVGTGFHGDLTGRENIFLNGALLGMSKAEIRTKFDEIVDFSGVEQFIDTPVRHYSSGMYVRLAFSVAAHLTAEILLIDEVLAVGDYEFQQKCLGKMGDLTNSGRTILFVSHDNKIIDQLCNKVIILEKGIAHDEISEKENRKAQSLKKFDLSLEGEPIDNISFTNIGSTLILKFKTNEKINNENLHVGVTISKIDGVIIFATNPKIRNEQVPNKFNELCIEIDIEPLDPGFYSLSIYLGNIFNDFLKLKDVWSFEINKIITKKNIEEFLKCDYEYF